MNTKRRTRPKLRFIPFRKKDIVEMCLSSGGFAGSEQIRFRDFCRLLESVYHFEFHKLLETLKDAYAPLNPDRDTRKVGVFGDEDSTAFVTNLDELLNKANYEQVSAEELAAAMEESSLFKLRLHINMDDFDEVLVYGRGESVRTETLTSFFGLIKKQVEFSNFDRVVIYIKFGESVVPRFGEVPGATMLKMFQNVPRADVEMLFPNTRLGMRLIDKLMIGVPALIGGGAILTTKIGTSMLLLGGLIGFWLGLSSEPVNLDKTTALALVAGIGGLGSYIWKQFINFKNRKLTFMQSLTESLYFKSLDNNAGVFHRLVDDAEEEECKEAMLAYYFLLTQAPVASAEALDEMIEKWFIERWDSELDFEVDDAIAKLTDLGLVVITDAGLEAVPLEQACQALDERWDQYFEYNKG